MIRQATSADIAAIAATYEELLAYEQEHGGDSHWELGVYPTIAVPERAVPAGEMVVLEEDGEIRASMILNHAQPAEYDDVAWRYPGKGEDVLVVHTLCVPPRFAGHGYGSRMVQYAKEYAAGHGCSVVRLDTYAHNEPAKRLYQRCGFRIAGWGTALLQGLIEEDQVFLECAMR